MYTLRCPQGAYDAYGGREQNTEMGRQTKAMQPGGRLLLLGRGPVREQVEESESSIRAYRDGTGSLGLPRQRRLWVAASQNPFLHPRTRPTEIVPPHGKCLPGDGARVAGSPSPWTQSPNPV